MERRGLGGKSVVKVRIFIEGGSPGEISNLIFKDSWKSFFEAAGLSRKMPGVVRGTSRTETFDKFKSALLRRKANEVLLLLVDSEGPVTAGHSVWQHLNERDNWQRPPDVRDDCAFLMVQFMETWFLADRDALRTVFKQDFNENPLREWPDLEAVSKDTVLSALRRATNDRYRKGEVSFKLLAETNPEQVAAACPHARELLDFLRGLNPVR